MHIGPADICNQIRAENRHLFTLGERTHGLALSGGILAHVQFFPCNGGGISFHGGIGGNLQGSGIFCHSSNGGGIAGIQVLAQHPALALLCAVLHIGPADICNQIRADNHHLFTLSERTLGSGVERGGAVQHQRFLCGGGSFLCNVDAIRLHWQRCRGVGDGRCVDGKVNIAGVQGIKRNPARSVQVNGLDVSPGQLPNGINA